MIARTQYLNQLRMFKDTNLIKVVTGIRRVGKSTLLQSFANQLRLDGISDELIQEYNFESPKTIDKLGSGWEDIFFSVVNNCVKSEKNYVFLDEVQNIVDFEKLLDGLFVEENIDLYVTGSNAKLLSSNLATLLTGRSIEIHVLPYSLKEYVAMQNDSDGMQEVFLNSYFVGSQLPEAVNLESIGRTAVLNYVEQVYLTVLENDIYPKIKDVNRRIFENVFKYVLSNIGSEISPTSIAKALRQDRVLTNHKTVIRYLELLCDSYLLYKVNRFDVKGKAQLATLEKYYVPDLGIRYLLVGQKDFSDRGHLLENLVYLELVRRGGKVWVGKSNSAEIDFVVKKDDGGIEYYQVAWSVNDESTFLREIKPLQNIDDSYPKFVVTNDLFEGNENGIQIKNFAKWALV